jgi:histidinol dehydrogenase
VTRRVASVIDEVRSGGDRALLRLTETFDKVRLTPAKLRVRPDEIAAAASRVRRDLRIAIVESAKRIEAYHRRQVRRGFAMTSAEGRLEQRIVPLGRAGIYVPGGHTVYPSSVLMNAIPANVAGVREIAAITPPRDGLDPGIAFALAHCGITEVYRVGGAQGVAALALGTRAVPAVDKIVGPGNAYVQTAKRLLYGTVDIDSVAGPSEVAVLADASANPEWVALDLLAQAEHGSGDESAVCVTEDAAFAAAVAAAVRAETAR